MNQSLALLGCLLVLSCATAVSAEEPESFKSGVFEPPRAAPDFGLQGSNGSPLKLADHRGKVVVLEFGFTRCEKICPTTLANMAQVYEKLGPGASEVQLVFITVDPERDSVARLREYLGYFNPTFVGGTGKPGELAAIRQAYGVLATKEVSDDQTNYQVHHSSSLYLIDRAGLLRALVPFGKSVDDIVHDLKLLLKK